jgi:chitinase
MERMIHMANTLKILALLVALIFSQIACSSSSSTPDNDNDDFVVTTDLEGKKEILKRLFTEAMYNTITEKSRSLPNCVESNSAELLPKDVQGLPNGQWYYTYDNLIAGMAKMENFATESEDENINKLEIAAFLANIAQETGTGVEVDPVYGGLGCFIQEGGGTARNSCVYGGCVKTPGYDTTAMCNEANDYKCPAGDLGWCGRGPHQLSWGANYLSYGEAMGAGNSYRNDPDLLTIHPDIGIAGSIWFWGHAEKSTEYPPDIPFKPSAHNVIVGKWTPTSSDVACGRTTPNLGVITNIINGGIECGPNASAKGRANAAKRVTFFNNIATVIGANAPAGWAVDCAEQQNFADCRSYVPTPDNPTRRCGTSWMEANAKCGTYCIDNTHCSGGEICFADLSQDPCPKVEP